MAIALTVLFCLTPIVLTIHLAVKKGESNAYKSNAYKKRLGYIYGGLWVIAFLGYGWIYSRTNLY